MPVTVEANLIYKVCAFETAWSKHYIAPWCAALDKDSIKVSTLKNKPMNLSEILAKFSIGMLFIQIKNIEGTVTQL